MFSQNATVVVAIVIIAILLLSAACTGSGPGSGAAEGQEAGTEGFYNYYGYYKKYCPSCGWRSRYSCAKCTNCGLKINASGQSECVPGDSSGPYFDNGDTVYWEYGDPYYYYPYSHVFPVVKTKSVYPYYRWNMRRPHRWSKWSNTNGATKRPAA